MAAWLSLKLCTFLGMSLLFPSILSYPSGVETLIPEIRPYLHFWRARPSSCLTTASPCFPFLALFTLPLDVTMYNEEPQLAWPRTKAQLTKSSPKLLDLLEPAPKLLSPFLTNPLCGTALTDWLSFCDSCCVLQLLLQVLFIWESPRVRCTDHWTPLHWLTLSLTDFPI